MNLYQAKIGRPGTKTSDEELNKWNERARAFRAAEPFFRSVDPDSIRTGDRSWTKPKAQR